MEHNVSHGFSPVPKVRRILEHYRHYHTDDGSRCTTPHDLCTREHTAVLVGRDVSDNLVVTAGLNALIGNTFNQVAASVNWYCGLVSNSSFTGYAASDTLASHAGWQEANPYSGNRPAWTKNGAPSNGSMSNSSNKASYSINASATIRGAFLASATSGTTGTLYGAGDFSESRTVSSGDTLALQIDVSAATE